MAIWFLAAVLFGKDVENLSYTSLYAADELNDAQEPKWSNMLALINELKNRTMTSNTNILEGYHPIIIAGPIEVVEVDEQM